MNLIEGLPSSNSEWKDDYFFVCGDNWEKLPEESEDYGKIRRSWGTPPTSGVCGLPVYFLLYT